MLLNNNCYFEDLGYMVDCSRGAVPTVKSLKKLISLLKDFGYTYIMLYTEDVYEVDGEPYFGYMRGKYSKAEIKELDEYCIQHGMELRACIQTLAHLGRIKRHSCYAELFEIDDIFTVKDDRVYKLIDKMFSSIASMFSCKKIHIGMDEAWALGRGKFFDLNGAVPKEEIMVYHLNEVSKIAKKYGFECDIWADMIMQSYWEAKDKANFSFELPDNITPIAWRYWEKSKSASEEEFELYMKLTNGKLGYAGGAQKWSGFVPNNQYSFFPTKEQMISCKKYGVKRYLLTAWADGAADASLYSTLPTIFYCSLLAHDLTLNNKTKKYFKEIVGISFDSYMKIDLLNRLTITSDDRAFNNLPFIYLYNDVLQGLYDNAVFENAEELFDKAGKVLNNLANKTNEFSYIFDPMAQLAKLLKYKASIGIKVYKHYQDKDKKGLKKDVVVLKKIIKLLEKFMLSYENQWHSENKAFGYEKQIIRLGGLKERLYYCIRQITLYINNIIDKIDELEENRLEISTRYWDHTKLSKNNHHNYSEIVSSGFLKEI